MITIRVTSNAQALLANLSLEPGRIKLATMRALNRTADGVVTDASREIRKRYNVAAKTLRGNDRRAGAFSITRAYPARLVSTVHASGNPLPLIGFAARHGKLGVSVAVKKGRRKLLRHAFIARMKSGHSGVFMRQGKSRLPIDEKYTVSVPGMLGAKEITAVLRPLTYARFDKAMAQNLRFALRRG